MSTATNVEATAVNTIGWLSASDTTIVVPVYQRQYRWDIGGCVNVGLQPDYQLECTSPAASAAPEESEANEFAAALLMPADLVRRHYERLRLRDPGGCFQELCRIFGTSGAAMSRRLRAMV